MDIPSAELIDSISPIAPMLIYVVIALLVLIESATLYGNILPGNLLLLSAGLLAGAHPDIKKTLLIGIAIAVNVFGSTLGYFIGRRFGRTFFKNQNAPRVEVIMLRSRKFYSQSRTVSVVLSKFAPGLRTFVPQIAGISRMNIATFIFANI
jgi:membrane-associated protein